MQRDGDHEAEQDEEEEDEEEEQHINEDDDEVKDDSKEPRTIGQGGMVHTLAYNVDTMLVDGPIMRPEPG
jgi:hypothetical protein